MEWGLTTKGYGVSFEGDDIVENSSDGCAMLNILKEHQMVHIKRVKSEFYDM